MVRVNHYAAVILGELGDKVRGYDYRRREDAEDMAGRMAARGLRAEVWGMDVYGRPVAALGEGGDHGVLAEGLA